MKDTAKPLAPKPANPIRLEDLLPAHTAAIKGGSRPRVIFGMVPPDPTARSPAAKARPTAS